MMYNWDVKIPGKEKKNYYCKEHKFSLMFTGLFILFIKARRASPGTLRIALRTLHPIISLPVTLRTTNAESKIIATLEVKYRTSRTNFTHRIAYNFFYWLSRLGADQTLVCQLRGLMQLDFRCLCKYPKICLSKSEISLTKLSEFISISNIPE